MRYLRKLQRLLKYQYLKLLRAKGGASSVAMGFGVGLFVEMFNLPTYGTSFLLVFPLIFLLRGHLAAALIGFVFGKIIYVPMTIPNAMVGGFVLPKHFNVHVSFLPEWANHLLLINLKLIVGGMIDGAILAAVCYFPIRYSVNAFKAKRKERRKSRRQDASGNAIL
ncbi:MULTISPECIES: DUF2062 domain-containing protein [Cohnella]|jgi:hypothetical protein|uniref:DUF2062 domain-containing protein n=1 Tax=Cohnella TaxID=329857 RepID=UPI000368BDA6|nr:MULTISPECIES: DUF2062 domain-containing protein [Cohnella]REK68540.1 MAG: DUF2062 domain-containing protein [Cohnella sp.]